jgi:hypothetical protein
MTDPASLRRISETALANAGARVNADLPLLAVDELVMRDGAQVARRALALNALARAALGWPREAAMRWLDAHGLAASLQPDELAYLRGPGQPSPADGWLAFHVETLGMAAWLGGLAPELLRPWDPLPEATAALFPDPHLDQSPQPFLQAFHLQPREEIEQLLDLYHRAHWHARQCESDGMPNETIPLASVQFRRLLLEWTCHADVDWHDTDLRI